MKNRDIGAEILVGIKEINEFKKGNLQLKVTEPSVPQIIRAKTDNLIKKRECNDLS